MSAPVTRLGFPSGKEATKNPKTYVYFENGSDVLTFNPFKMIFGLTPLGVFHTAVSLVAVATGVIASVVAAEVAAH